MCGEQLKQASLSRKEGSRHVGLTCSEDPPVFAVFLRSEHFRSVVKHEGKTKSTSQRLSRRFLGEMRICEYGSPYTKNALQVFWHSSLHHCVHGTHESESVLEASWCRTAPLRPRRRKESHKDLRHKTADVVQALSMQRTQALGPNMRVYIHMYLYI